MSAHPPGLNHAHVWLIRRSGARECLYCTATMPRSAHVFPCNHDFLHTPNGVLYCVRCRELHEE